MKKADRMLWEGVEENDIRKVALALNLGADVNAKSVYGYSPLHRARSVTIAELLISAGADVNSKDRIVRSPLHWAACGNNIALAKLLISSGADVKSKDKYFDTPLDDAKSQEMKELLQGVKP